MKPPPASRVTIAILSLVLAACAPATRILAPAPTAVPTISPDERHDAVYELLPRGTLLRSSERNTEDERFWRETYELPGLMSGQLGAVYTACGIFSTPQEARQYYEKELEEFAAKDGLVPERLAGIGDASQAYVAYIGGFVGFIAAIKQNRYCLVQGLDSASRLGLGDIAAVMRVYLR